MSTSNFWKTNLPSGVVYAFAMWHGDWHTEDAYEETIELVKEKLWLCEYKNEEWIDRYKKIIGYINVTFYNKESKEWEWWAIDVIVEHGYYGWARIDISIESILDNFPPLNRTQEKEIEREVKRIEKVLKEVCPVKLRKVWSFSNWEWIYEYAK